MKVINFDKLDTNMFTYSEPKKHDNRYYVLMHTNEDSELPQKIFFQTPKMKVKLPHVEDYVDCVCEQEEWKVFIQSMDTHMREVIKTNSETWFGEGKQIDDTFLDVGQTPSLMSNGVCRFKMANDLDIYNQDKEEMTFEDIEQGQEVKGISQLVGLWFTKTRWGLTYKMCQMKMYKTKHKVVRGYMFPEDPDDENPEDTDMLDLKPPPGIE